MSESNLSAQKALNKNAANNLQVSLLITERTPSTEEFYLISSQALNF